MAKDENSADRAPARTITLQASHVGERPLSMCALRAQVKGFSPERLKTFFNGFSLSELADMRELIDSVHRELAELRGE
jgi:hypothetical protein